MNHYFTVHITEGNKSKDFVITSTRDAERAQNEALRRARAEGWKFAQCSGIQEVLLTQLAPIHS